MKTGLLISFTYALTVSLFFVAVVVVVGTKWIESDPYLAEAPTSQVAARAFTWLFIGADVPGFDIFDVDVVLSRQTPIRRSLASACPTSIAVYPKFECHKKAQRAQNERMRKRWLLILSCATLLAFIYSARSVFITISQGRTIDWARLIVFEFQYWYVWAVLTPLVLWFARRFELQRTNWRRPLLALIVFGLIIAPFQATVEYFIAFGFDIWRGMSQDEIMRRAEFIKRAIVVEAFSNFIIYSLIVCGHYAYEYYRRYRERELRSVELEGRLAQAELQNLKMQLHPHFLFNTLNSISVLMMRDVELANRMLVRLSDLLRITLDSAGTQMVSLKQELDFLRGYLEIERTRFRTGSPYISTFRLLHSSGRFRI